MPGFDVGVPASGLPCLVLDLALENLDLVDFAETEILAIDKGLDGAEKCFAQLQIAGDGPEFDQGLAFPGAAESVVVCQRAGERTGEWATVPFGSKAQIDAIGLTLL